MHVLFQQDLNVNTWACAFFDGVFKPVSIFLTQNIHVVYLLFT